MTAVPRALLAVVLAALLITGLRPYDRAAWLFEASWVLVGVPVVLLTWRRFPLTTLLCCLLAAHALILCYGAAYTYARTPLGDWVRDALGWDRNPYDRLGHFAQGFVPAIGIREVLVRLSPLRGPDRRPSVLAGTPPAPASVRSTRWLAPLVVCACLAFSAVFELLEWWGSLIAGTDLLASQGDRWDTQWDMLLAGVGSVVALLLLSRWHDRQLRSGRARLTG
jgi:putative membrane protein